MLQKLFGSPLRFKVLRALLHAPAQSWTEHALHKKTRVAARTLHKIIEDLESVGLLVVLPQGKTQTVALNTTSLVYPDLRTLFVKSELFFEREFLKRLARCGNPSYVALMGRFVGDMKSHVDVFLVGTFQQAKLKSLMKSCEKELDRDINYSVMSRREFEFRRTMTDKFLYDMLERKKIVAINRLSI